MKHKEFYNILANVYDDMIDFDSALKRRIDLLSNIVRDYKTAADLGCGTGIDSIALYKLGLKTHAFDKSNKMINKAKLNASKYNADIQFFTSPLENITSPDTFDLIISLGNTLANLNDTQLRKTLAICSSSLNEGGKIVIQILNYKLVREKIHNINEMENSRYHVKRYYEKSGAELLFKIKIVDKENESEDSIETIVFPHSPKLIKQICNDEGIKINFYGSLNLSRFDINESKDLVIIGGKLSL
jgi:SAM-dependent methyltransferase